MGLHENHLTGRERTIRFAGSIEMPYYRERDMSLAAFGNDIAVQSDGVISFGQYDIQIEVFAGHVGSAGANGIAGHYYLRVTSPSPLFIDYYQEVELWPTSPGLTTYGGTITGTFEIEIDVAEERMVEILPSPEIPWWNVSDGPAANVTFIERLRGNFENLRVAVSFGSLIYEEIFDRPETEGIGVGFDGYYADASANIRTRKATGPQTAQIVLEDTNYWINRTNEIVKAGTIPYSFTGSFPPSNVPYTQTVTSASGIRVTSEFAGAVTGILGANEWFTTQGQIQQFLPVLSTFHFKTKAFEDDYPSALSFFITGPNGSELVSVPVGGTSEDNDAINGDFDGPSSTAPFSAQYGTGTVATYSTNLYPYGGEIAPGYTFEARVHEPSYVGGIDAAGDSRVQGRGNTFGSLQIEHDAELELESFDGPTGWTPANASLSGSTTLIIETDAVSGGAFQTFSPTISCEAWRFWELRIRSSGDANVPVTIIVNGVKTFVARTGADGAWIDYEIDTAYPRAVDSSVSANQDSRWPLKSSTDDRPNVESKHWGVNYIETLEFQIPAGRIVEIDSLAATRQNPPRLQFVSAHPDGRQQWYIVPAGSAPDRKRHLLALVDGRTGHEIPDAQGGATLSPLTIAEYVDEINTVDGWSASFLALVDPYFNDDLPAQFIAGGGAIWDEVDYESFTDKQMPGSSFSVQAQFLWDRLHLYPGIGDVWADTGYDDPEARANLRFVKLMRGAGIGLLESKGRPVAGADVSIYRTLAGDLRGTGTTDDLGFYMTELPYGAPLVTHDFRTDFRTLGQAVLYARKRTRVNGKWKDFLSGTLSYDVSSSLRHYRVYIEGDTVQFGYSDNTLGWQDSDTGIEAETLCLRIERRGKKQRLYLWTGTEGGTIESRYSDDEGANWTMPETISLSGNTPAAEIGLNGRRYIYWLDGGDVKGKILDASDQTLEDEFTAISGVDEEGLAVSESVIAGGKHRIVILAVQGGTITSFQSFDGINFS